MKNFEKHLKPQ